VAERRAGAVDLVLAGLPAHLHRRLGEAQHPEAPIGFDDSTPPDMFTGRSPSSAVAPS
jgi:hypothetical protein